MRDPEETSAIIQSAFDRKEDLLVQVAGSPGLMTPATVSHATRLFYSFASGFAPQIPHPLVFLLIFC